MSERQIGKFVPQWILDEIQRVIDEMQVLSKTGGPVYLRLSPETLHEWLGLLCAVKYIDSRVLTQDEKDYATKILERLQLAAQPPTEEQTK